MVSLKKLKEDRKIEKLPKRFYYLNMIKTGEARRLQLKVEE